MRRSINYFTGFMDSGKTHLIKKMIADDILDFNGENVLLIITENGIEKYSDDFLAANNIHIESMKDFSEYTASGIEKLCEKHKCVHVIVELNGFWPCIAVEAEVPAGFEIENKYFCSNMKTFYIYYSNLSQQTGEKIAYSSAVFVNRANNMDDIDNVCDEIRKYSKRADIYYANESEEYVQYQYAEKLPYKLNSETVEIPDFAFPFFLKQIEDNPAKYIDTKIALNGFFVRDSENGDICFGRNVLSRMIGDGEFWGLHCHISEESGTVELQNGKNCTAFIRKDNAGRQDIILDVISFTDTVIGTEAQVFR